MIAPPSAAHACAVCGSHRTQVTGHSSAPPGEFVGCSTCGDVALVLQKSEAAPLPTARRHPVEHHVILVGAATLDHLHAYAEAIHQASDRRSSPLVVVTCDELPPAVLESELFGHSRGSFPGAYRDMAGALERASGGTLFLYRMDLLPPVLAERLQEALTTGASHRIGDASVRYRVRARVIGTSLDAQCWSSSAFAALRSSFTQVRVRPPRLVGGGLLSPRSHVF